MRTGRGLRISQNASAFLLKEHAHMHYNHLIRDGSKERGDRMIYTWILDVTGLQDERLYKKVYERMPAFRREKADRLKQMDQKAQSVGAWALYEQMKAHYHLSEDHPYNLSHSGKYALCAVSDRAGERVGCDVEMIDVPRWGIAERFFCPSEAAWIRGQNSETEQIRAFYWYWVLKESFVKAIRQGLRQDLKGFEIAMTEQGPKLIRQPEDYPEIYHYREYHLAAEDACVAVCSTESEFEELRYLDEQKII